MVIGKWAYSSMAEQSAHNALVAGSNPAGPTKMTYFQKKVGRLILKSHARLERRQAVACTVSGNVRTY